MRSELMGSHLCEISCLSSSVRFSFSVCAVTAALGRRRAELSSLRSAPGVLGTQEFQFSFQAAACVELL